MFRCKKRFYFTTFTTITTRRKTLPQAVIPPLCSDLHHIHSCPPPNAATTAVSTRQGGFEVMAAVLICMWSSCKERLLAEQKNEMTKKNLPEAQDTDASQAPLFIQVFGGACSSLLS